MSAPLDRTPPSPACAYLPGTCVVRSTNLEGTCPSVGVFAVQVPLLCSNGCRTRLRLTSQNSFSPRFSILIHCLSTWSSGWLEATCADTGALPALRQRWHGRGNPWEREPEPLLRNLDDEALRQMRSLKLYSLHRYFVSIDGSADTAEEVLGDTGAAGLNPNNPDAVGLAPGTLSGELRAALGIAPAAPPPWLARMKRMGYPPGYLAPEGDASPAGKWQTVPNMASACILKGLRRIRAGACGRAQQERRSLTQSPVHTQVRKSCYSDAWGCECSSAFPHLFFAVCCAGAADQLEVVFGEDAHADVLAAWSAASATAAAAAAAPNGAAVPADGSAARPGTEAQPREEASTAEAAAVSRLVQALSRARWARDDVVGVVFSGVGFSWV